MNVAREKWSPTYLTQKVKSFFLGKDQPENQVELRPRTIGEMAEHIKTTDVNRWSYLSVKYPQVSEEKWTEIWKDQTPDTYVWLKRMEREARRERKIEKRRARQAKKKRRRAEVPKEQLAVIPAQTSVPYFFKVQELMQSSGEFFIHIFIKQGLSPSSVIT